MCEVLAKWANKMVKAVSLVVYFKIGLKHTRKKQCFVSKYAFY